jgi:hypothetical protein
MPFAKLEAILPRYSTIAFNRNGQPTYDGRSQKAPRQRSDIPFSAVFGNGHANAWHHSRIYVRRVQARRMAAEQGAGMDARAVAGFHCRLALSADPKFYQTITLSPARPHVTHPHRDGFNRNCIFPCSKISLRFLPAPLYMVHSGLLFRAGISGAPPYGVRNAKQTGEICHILHFQHRSEDNSEHRVHRYFFVQRAN